MLGFARLWSSYLGFVWNTISICLLYWCSVKSLNIDLDLLFPCSGWIICLRVYGVSHCLHRHPPLASIHLGSMGLFDLRKSDNFLIEIEMASWGLSYFELEVWFLSWVLERVVFVVVELLWIWLVLIGFSFLVDYVIIVAFYWFGLVWTWWILQFRFRVLTEFIY